MIELNIDELMLEANSLFGTDVKYSDDIVTRLNEKASQGISITPDVITDLISDLTEGDILISAICDIRSNYTYSFRNLVCQVSEYYLMYGPNSDTSMLRTPMNVLKSRLSSLIIMSANGADAECDYHDALSLCRDILEVGYGSSEEQFIGVLNDYCKLRRLSFYDIGRHDLLTNHMDSIHRLIKDTVSTEEFRMLMAILLLRRGPIEWKSEEPADDENYALKP